MHVGLITYQRGHLKTWQLTRKMLTNGYRVTLFAFPFKERTPKPGPERYRDRPAQLNVSPWPLLGTVGVINLQWNEGILPFFEADVFLHCTAKIIPPAFIAGRRILNCHPGLLPQNRGVDAFKWSIINKWPIGVTLHQIDEQIDRGTILKRMPVPVFDSDSLADVCQRMYDFEIDLLGNFEHHLPGENVPVGDEFPCSHQMIPIEQDQRLEELFGEWKNTRHAEASRGAAE